MKYRQIFINRIDYYAEGKHGASSASRDLVFEVYDKVAPTVFAYLTREEELLMDELISLEETYRAKMRFISQCRENRDIQDLRERVAQIKLDLSWLKPVGEIINLSDYVASVSGWRREMALEIIVPVNSQMLKFQREIVINKQNAALEDTLFHTIKYIEENITRKYHRWHIEQLRGPIFFKRRAAKII